MCVGLGYTPTERQAPLANDPLLTTFFTCDRMLRDAITQRWCAIGIYNKLFVPSFPFGLEEMWWYARVADAPDEMSLYGQIVTPRGVVVRHNTWTFSQKEQPQGMPIDGWWEIGGRFCEV